MRASLSAISTEILKSVKAALFNILYFIVISSPYFAVSEKSTDSATISANVTVTYTPTPLFTAPTPIELKFLFKIFFLLSGVLIKFFTIVSAAFLSVKGIDRIILHNSGANNSFGFEDVDFEIVEKANLFHFGYPSIMRHMYANEGEEFIRLFKNVKQSGAATSLDMAIADEMSEGGKADWDQILQTVMPYVDIFAPSFEELVYFIDRSMYYELIEKSKDKDITDVLSIQKHVRPLADKLMKWGAKIVIIKCGARGIYFRTNTQNHIKNIGGGLSTSLLSWSCQEYFERSYKPERVVSAMGAGDVSIAAFLYSALKGIDWKEALHFAAAAGASCVTTYDALSGLESFQVMGEKIKNGWEKVE